MPQGKPDEGARRETDAGYIEIHVGGRWQLEHRHVVEQHIGRKLKRSEVVHHINERKGDNRPQNLMVFSSSGGHKAYHEGRNSKCVWDGRRVPETKASPKPEGEGPALTVRVVKQTAVNWRNLEWFQGDLKQSTREEINALKQGILQRGFVDAFRVWRDPSSSKTWILDGHRRKMALAELESEGVQIPDRVPALWLDCRDEAEAAEFVLVYSSTFGKVGEDQLVEFVKEKGVEVKRAAAGISLPRIDFAALMREYLNADGVLEILKRAETDMRARRGFSQIKVRDPRKVPLVAAFLNAAGIEHELKEATNESRPV